MAIKIFKSYEAQLSNDFVSPQNSEELENVYNEGKYTYIQDRGNIFTMSMFFLKWDGIDFGKMFEFLSSSDFSAPKMSPQNYFKGLLKIHAVRDCGNFKRTIYCPENDPKNLIVIGCTLYTYDSAIETINKNYNSLEAREYIVNVKMCFEGVPPSKMGGLDIEECQQIMALIGNNEQKRILSKSPYSSVMELLTI